MLIAQNKNFITQAPPELVRQFLSSFSNGMNFFGAESLPAGKRKAILKTGLALLAISAAGYLLLSGAIVSNNLKSVALSREFGAESQALDSVRQELIEGSSVLTIDRLGELGYKETKNLNVLKRTNNVAGKNIQSFQ